MVSNTSLLIQVTPQSVSIVSPAPAPQFSSTLSKNIGISILAMLPISDLAATSCINRSWRNWTKDDLVWQHRPSQDVRDNFAALVKERFLSWKEVCFYTPLFHCVSDLIIRRMTDFIRIEKNPELRRPAPPYPNSVIPIPYVQYGNYHFAICNSKDIEMWEEGEPPLTLFSGEDRTQLTHLAIEGNFLFALRKGGRIVQLNYRTGEVKDIHTDLETGANQAFNRICTAFYVKNGFILISSSQWYSQPTRLEIISYKDPTERQLISHDSDTDPYLDFSKIILKDNQIIGKKYNSIWIRNLSTLETKTYKFASGIVDMNLDQHILYVVDYEQKIHKIDLKSGVQTYKIHLDTDLSNKKLRTIVNDLAFTLHPSKKLTVEDLRSGVEEVLLEDQSENSHDVAAYKKNLLKKFIERIKRKPSSYPRLTKIFKLIQKSNDFKFLRLVVPVAIKAFCLWFLKNFLFVGFSCIKRMISKR